MSARLTIKIISRKGIYVDRHARGQLPGGEARWGEARFLFDRDAREYDWLVVYHDLPGGASGFERLRCPRENTVLVTHEPPAIKSYGRDFCAQFGRVLSCHDSRSLPHPRLIRTHPGSLWFYGIDFLDSRADGQDYDRLKNAPPPRKTRTLSTCCSDKKMRHTLHRSRYEFTRRLARALPALDWFGRGVNAVGKKSDAIDSYRYHLAIENQICAHYWTEKIADAFLGCALPFYCGAPNLAEYFPPQSFIPIDILDFEGALATIQRAIADGEYEKRLPHILEARRRVLEEHNLYAMLARALADFPAASESESAAADETILSRRRLLLKNPRAAARYLVEKWRNRAAFAFDSALSNRRN